MTEQELKIVEAYRGILTVGAAVTGLVGIIGGVGAGIYHGQTGQPLIGKGEGVEEFFITTTLCYVSGVLGYYHLGLIPRSSAATV